jgi:hypothetical protein
MLQTPPIHIGTDVRSFIYPNSLPQSTIDNSYLCCADASFGATCGRMGSANDRLRIDVVGLNQVIKDVEGTHYQVKLMASPTFQSITKKNYDVFTELLNVLGSFKTIIVMAFYGLVILVRWSTGKRTNSEKRRDDKIIDGAANGAVQIVDPRRPSFVIVNTGALSPGPSSPVDSRRPSAIPLTSV